MSNFAPVYTTESDFEKKKNFVILKDKNIPYMDS